ncbi:hypothetical protein [Niveispirillum sp. KHB5.9]|uniref:hypothetical protein n=1 Tax=Niveispirillum sp. KHB5.9 TaxID=3400269 RepID=UPI003A83AEB6
MRTQLTALALCTLLAAPAQAQGALFRPDIVDYDVQVDSKDGMVTCGYSYRAVYKDNNGKTQAAMGTVNLVYSGGKEPSLYSHKSIAASYSDSRYEIKRRPVLHSAIASRDLKVSSRKADGQRVEDYYLATRNLKDRDFIELFSSSMEGFVLSLTLEGVSDDPQIQMPSFREIGKPVIGDQIARCMQSASARGK